MTRVSNKSVRRATRGIGHHGVHMLKSTVFSSKCLEKYRAPLTVGLGVLSRPHEVICDRRQNLTEPASTVPPPLPVAGWSSCTQPHRVVEGPKNEGETIFG